MKTLDEKKAELSKVLADIEGLRVKIKEIDATKKRLAASHRTLEDLALKLAQEIAGQKTLF